MTRHTLTNLIQRERTAVLVVNVCSRSGKRHYRRILEALCRHDFRVLAAYPVREPCRLREVMREAMGRGSHLMIVGGGDGTVSAVVDELAFHDDIALGIVPLGTGNSAARTLEIPLTVKRAVDAIIAGKVVDIDLGRVNDNYFINTVTIGLTAEAGHHVSYRCKRFFGQLAYFLSGLTMFLHHRAFRATITHNGEQLICDAHEVVIENGRYFGGTLISSDASIQSGRLVVDTVEPMNIWQLGWRIMRFLVFRRPGLPSAHHLQTASLHIATDPPQLIDIDGEPFIRTPADVAVVPQAVRVMVPPWATAR